MLALLSPRLWLAIGLAVILAASHGFAYKSGRAAVRAQWDAEKAIQLKQTLELQSQYRQKEQEHAQRLSDAQQAARKRENLLQSQLATLRVSADSLRDDLATYRSQLPGASCDSVRKHADALNTVFGQCARAIGELAGKADGHAGDALMLRDAWPK
jgi:seryl-tRNA synthetase